MLKQGWTVGNKNQSNWPLWKFFLRSKQFWTSFNPLFFSSFRPLFGWMTLSLDGGPQYNGVCHHHDRASETKGSTTLIVLMAGLSFLAASLLSPHVQVCVDPYFFYFKQVSMVSWHLWGSNLEKEGFRPLPWPLPVDISVERGGRVPGILGKNLSLHENPLFFEPKILSTPIEFVAHFTFLTHIFPTRASQLKSSCF